MGKAPVYGIPVRKGTPKRDPRKPSRPPPRKGG
jgi:hypothetical protein